MFDSHIRKFICVMIATITASATAWSAEPPETARPDIADEGPAAVVDGAEQPIPALPGPTDDLIAAWLDRLEAEAAAVTEAMEQPRTVVSPGYTLRNGSNGPRVLELSSRLAELGYLAEDQVGPAFDDTVTAAVERFQGETGLHVDGLVGPQTLSELNRTLEETLHALRWTIDEMRSFRVGAPEEMLIVNVPSTRAWLVRDGEIVMDMRAAVGRYTRQTPLLADRIVDVTLNPRWSVPPTIMREDVLPLLRAEGRTGVTEASVYLNGERVDPTQVDWSEVSPWEIFIRQTAGDHSALGRYLFNLTNDQNIFVHDTNAHSVFDRANRWVSSGCIRVEDARALALYLADRAGYTEADLDRRLHSGATQSLPLGEHELPVFITYWTATPETDRIVYHRDIYRVAANYRPVAPVAATDTAGPEAAGSGS